MPGSHNVNFGLKFQIGIYLYTKNYWENVGFDWTKKKFHLAVRTSISFFKKDQYIYLLLALVWSNEIFFTFQKMNEDDQTLLVLSKHESNFLNSAYFSSKEYNKDPQNVTNKMIMWVGTTWNKVYFEICVTLTLNFSFSS